MDIFWTRNCLQFCQDAFNTEGVAMLENFLLIRRMMCAPIILGSSLFLSACYHHSFPVADRFVQSQRGPNYAEVFVDANGSFYPSEWRVLLSTPRHWPAGSLLNHSSAMRNRLTVDEPRQLADIAAFGREKKRIFILVHGYNNTVAEATPAYEAIETRLGLKASDGIIRFYWDGLTGSGLGGGRIWFWATGNSQLAGSRGLRRLLDQFSDKDIYLIAHSRGSSVVLSALGNPVYDPDFLADTKKLAAAWSDSANFLAPPPLGENGNRIHILLLAPAIDRIDFCDASEQPTTDRAYTCRRLRPLGKQVVSLRYTVNAKDPILRKYVGLAAKFNPTGLGTTLAVGCALQKDQYPLMREYILKPEKIHRFSWYVGSKVFDRMLADEGLGVQHADQVAWAPTCNQSDS
ncbi:alpha/beta hydrolase [Sphingomonas sp. RT2P30]|uniref:alpha/beta hydrolase n=1 Tax=Parasphingomonas halimpatiens TaxID=3096162 RepID=UPI002FC656F4